ncbi:hypothetical protein BpHYR1_004884 [Brachionus plicatilis]|uniref:Uncharacterized protein n=1 Tax=Brachionus plicatilis TaxID=10195 RepID=A0A3M7RR41_BRAPC|nr:hypothetical protein BpHYR1_004884 [Brachionus plicatilis]
MGLLKKFQAILLLWMMALTILNVSCDRQPRVKRQYIKPNIDGSWLANERSYLINQMRMRTTTQSNDELVTSPKPEISVTSLSISLINLFDRIKGTLCNIINYSCSSSQPKPN